jgi:hypothetical protein
MVNMHLIFSVFCDYHTSGIPHLGLEIGHRRRRRRRHRPARHTQAAADLKPSKLYWTLELHARLLDLRKNLLHEVA